MKEFFEQAAMLNHPLRILQRFLDQEKANEQAKQYDKMRFVGYVLEIGYDTVTIITSDPFKIAVGGVPRNSLLIMVPSSYDTLPPHFTLLRVLESAPTPLSKEVQQTYFELQKKSMPELDIFTQSELQWGALKTAVLGMFYPHPERMDEVEFSGDLNNFVSAHKYRVYAPDDDLLNLITNSMVPNENRFPIGDLRLTECRLPLQNKPHPKVTVYVSTKDFMGTRTAMFGKTRLGKSNVVKLIAQSLIETTKDTKNVGQLIFDINGEYANDNPQDNSQSLRSAYPERCVVYALTPKSATPSNPLKINFYEHPEKSKSIIRSLLEQDGRASGYVRSFTSVELPSLDEIRSLPSGGDQARALRKIQIFWAILKKAGYSVDERQLFSVAPTGNPASRFNPGFNVNLRSAAYSSENITPTPQHPSTLDELVRELEIINRFRRANLNHQSLTTGSGNPLFDADDVALLEFLEPQPGRSGVSLIQPYRIYHDRRAGDFINEIIKYLDSGVTVILDLGNANPEVMNYFSDELSLAVLRHQVDKFSNNQLGNHFIQLYFEEAHNLFPHSGDVTTIYSRLAKEGAKYHIGMVYSTQSPTTINKDLLAQTENFFVAHLASQDDVNTLAKVNIAYETLKDDILQAKTVGYIRMLTRSHRFVISVQARKFTLPNSNPEGK
ncbi:ATP-binding protein [Rosettibacter firmus]|uniref:ATP-binding protein n=1 Tax=Rosettibacter firmus TaxID=3111522 RepID=UPI00336BD33A